MSESLVYVPVSLAELFDKISILEIKAERIASEAKLANVQRELELLRNVAAGVETRRSNDLVALCRELKAANLRIWEAEDVIRDCERNRSFDADFVAVARSIYHLNDERAAIKQKINLLTSSPIVEEKSYSEYRTADRAASRT